jgi:YVTN family beta-propeller protein
MTPRAKLLSTMALSLALGLGIWAAHADPPGGTLDTFPGMPPVTDPVNLYRGAAAGELSLAAAEALPRVYVPNLRSNDVYVIDPATLRVVDRFRVGRMPQHIVPSWDLKTLWVNGNGLRGTEGSLTPIDPRTGKPGAAIPIADPYNLYFTPDGGSAIVVAERLERLDFRDPHTMALQQSLPTPGCAGVNHADFALDGKYAVFTCEFGGGGLIKVDLVERKVVGHLNLIRTNLITQASLTLPEDEPVDATLPGASLTDATDPSLADATITGAFCGSGVNAFGSMPQDIRVSPDGKLFYVADMMADGVYVVDGAEFKQVGYIPTGVGTHGLYPSRDGTKLYVVNRGSHDVRGRRRGPGSISVLDFATQEVVANWPIPRGGSPDMGNVSADGRFLWLSGRYDNVVYVIDTNMGGVATIPVGTEPHGLTVWPQPGRYSLGHTGNMR